MLGISLVMKAWLLSVSADIWGDEPYTQAGQPDTYPTLAYDPQKTVYDSLQNALSEAITALGAGAGAGPSSAELVYKGDRLKWAALAHTMKARLYLHTAERDASSYAKALAEANLGMLRERLRVARCVALGDVQIEPSFRCGRARAISLVALVHELGRRRSGASAGTERGTLRSTLSVDCRTPSFADRMPASDRCLAGRPGYMARRPRHPPTH